MSYKITITKIDTKTVTKRGEHTIIGERPWTKDEVNEETRWAQTPVEFLKSNPIKRVYGYAPDWQGIETTETEVLKQTVEELDLAAVIKAVNGL